MVWMGVASVEKLVAWWACMRVVMKDEQTAVVWVERLAHAMVDRMVV